MIPTTYKAVFEVRNDTYTTQANDPNATEWQVEINLGSLMKGDKGDKGDAATITVGTPTATSGTTPAVSVNNSGDEHDAVFDFAFTLPKGDKGDTGNGIRYIQKTGTSGNVDIYTVTYTDNTTTTFSVTNGLDGADGTNGSDGVSIISIVRTSTSGNVDTYTISYSNGTSSTFTVTNGVDGDDGAAAGFGTISADVDSGIGTPGVSVSTGGPNTAKNIQFHFTNLKGEVGPQGPVGRGLEIKGEVVGSWVPPQNPQAGDAYYCTGDGKLHVYDGTAWFTIEMAAGTLDTTATTSQTTASSESLGGGVVLHKISKTGQFADLILPSGGITSSSLSTAIQVALGKADTALQASDITGKADKVSSATNNNFAGLDSNGNLKDSGSKASDFASASHSHGNIQNTGALQSTDITIATGDKLVVTDASDNNKVARASVGFDGSTTTKALTQKGTFETFLQSQDISNKADKATTLAGYGITDAKIANGVITLGSNSITPLTSQVNSDWNAVSGAAQILNKPTIPTTMTGATASVAGTSGTVPAPAAGDQNKYLKGNGTWDTISVSAEIPVATSIPAGGMLPNVFYNLGSIGITSFTLSSGSVPNTALKHWYWKFTAAVSYMDFPVSLTWVGGSAPSITSGKTYEISVIDNVAAYIEY